MMAGLLGVAVTEAMVAAVNSLLKKIPHAPSCESFSIVIVLVWFFISFSQLGVESVISPFGFFSPPQHQGCIGQRINNNVCGLIVLIPSLDE